MITWFLKTRLRRLGARAVPRREFVVKLEQTLSSHGYLSLPRVWWTSLWKTVVFSSTVAVSLSGVTATYAYAYASPDVLPDHPLYGLRTQIEHLETRLAGTPVQKGSVALNHLHRRIEEAQRILIVRKQPLPVAHTKRILKTVERVTTLVKSKATDQEYAEQTLGLEGNDLSDLTDQESQTTDAQEEHRVTIAIVSQLHDMDEAVGSLAHPVPPHDEDQQDE